MTSLTEAQEQVADQLAHGFAVLQLAILASQPWTDDEKRQVLRAVLDTLDRAYTETCVAMGLTVQ